MRSFETVVSRDSRWIAAALVAMAISVVAVCAAAEEAGRRVGDATEFESRLDDSKPSIEQAAERLRTATPEMREARLERLALRLRGASRFERRRILRREARILRALPDEDRERIERENEAYREKHGILSFRDRQELAESGEFDFSPKERRILRARMRELPAEERRELMHKIKNVRELPQSERQELHQRLDDMKSLSAEEREAFREKAKRWREMPEERREKLRAQMKKLREMPIDERMELLERALENAEEGAPH